mmetsp:Transcript_17984/g.32987  ORF Transcript_17984/g.32987 Transcript_17984/m.32987 type:complete len:284 (-) Transcript_17984:277-1128(-)
MAQRPSETHVPIIPEGFDGTAHAIFRKFEPPSFAPLTKPDLLETARTEYLEAGTGIKLDNFDPNDLDTSCPICLSTLDAPVTLCGCSHSFCFDCLQRWLSVGTESCPLCKCEITIFIDARPQGTQHLFSRKDVEVLHPIPGIDLAVRVQAALHRLLEVSRAELPQYDDTSSESCTSSSSHGSVCTLPSSACSADAERVEVEPPLRKRVRLCPRGQKDAPLETCGADESVRDRNSRNSTEREAAGPLSQILAHLDSDINGARQEVCQLGSAAATTGECVASTER